METNGAAGKAKALFDRAGEVAGTGNLNFAISLYLSGIALDPANVEHGHGPLRQAAVRRKALGDWGLSTAERLKYAVAGKDQDQRLQGAVYLLSREPGEIDYMERLLDAARESGLDELVEWACGILREALTNAKKPDKRILKKLARTYESAGDLDSAVGVATFGLQSHPEDPEILQMEKDLSGNLAIQHGGYERAAAASVLNPERQQELAQGDLLYQGRSFVLQQIDKAREEYKATPTVVGKIDALVDGLLKLEEEPFEAEAIAVLTSAHQSSRNYHHKKRLDDIRLRQMKRRLRQLDSGGDAAQAQALTKELEAFELEVFAERARNYPTDCAVRFELGNCQFRAARWNDAIASFQFVAQRDAKRKTASLSTMGQAFVQKKWHKEAVASFRNALKALPEGGDDREIRYYLALALEGMGDKEAAAEELSLITQKDIGFKDAADRLDKLRSGA